MKLKSSLRIFIETGVIFRVMLAKKAGSEGIKQPWGKSKQHGGSTKAKA